MKPLILMTPSYDVNPAKPAHDFVYRVNATYVQALEAAGCVPVMCGTCDFSALADRCDGVLFTGGVDIDPKYFSEDVLNDTVCICDLRDTLELALFDVCFQKKLPMLGICRGIQLLNVALGGSLWQDIPAQLPDALPHSDARHTVETVPGSLVQRLCGDTFVSNSYHHQAVREPGRGLKVTARASDGVIEAVEHDSLPILGIQWHPERMLSPYKPEGVAEMAVIFDCFARICGKS
ncbi:MAG: gamma-glutamyl-gamma-aminobutyrate hydrolase family protein [Eubacteriales bacterium]|jgi:putative glutamine amidotransferase